LFGFYSLYYPLIVFTKVYVIFFYTLFHDTPKRKRTHLIFFFIW